MKIASVNGFNYAHNYTNKNSFQGKLNLNGEYLIDTDLIASAANVKDQNKVLINLKEPLFYRMPEERQLHEYHRRINSIIDSLSTLKEPVTYEGGYQAGGYNKPRSFQVINTPERAEKAIENFKERFWEDYAVKQIYINMPYEAFLNIYEDAIRPENSAKLYNLP